MTRGIEIDAADLCGQSPKVHWLDDARARAKVENDGCGVRRWRMRSRNSCRTFAFRHSRVCGNPVIR